MPTSCMSSKHSSRIRCALASGSDIHAGPSAQPDETTVDHLPSEARTPKTWGLPHLVGKERARVNSANKLSLRINELMEHCQSQDVPFYLENPASSKLWGHPIIRKWIQHDSSHKVEVDYCQFGTDWKKATSILSVGNKKFHTGKAVKCKLTWQGKVSICSQTVKTHQTLSGFVDNAEECKCKTNVACPYPY